MSREHTRDGKVELERIENEEDELKERALSNDPVYLSTMKRIRALQSYGEDVPIEDVLQVFRFKLKLLERSQSDLASSTGIDRDNWVDIFRLLSNRELAKMASLSTSFYLFVRSPLLIYRDVECCYPRNGFSDCESFKWILRNAGEIVDSITLDHSAKFPSVWSLICIYCENLRILRSGTIPPAVFRMCNKIESISKFAPVTVDSLKQLPRLRSFSVYIPEFNNELKDLLRSRKDWKKVEILTNGSRNNCLQLLEESTELEIFRTFQQSNEKDLKILTIFPKLQKLTLSMRHELLYRCHS